MHTCGTSMSPPSSVQQVWWRDGLDLQRDGAVQVVESFCSRASPTRSREGEREEGSRAARVGGGGAGGGCAPSPINIEGWEGSPCPSPKPSAGGQGREEWGASLPPPSRSSPRVSLGFGRMGPMGPCAPAQCVQGTPS